MRLDAEGRGIGPRRYLARQFARPAGPVGRWLIGPWLDRIAAPMNRLALDALRVGPGHRVLEIGFGGGGLLRAILARTSGDVHGVDVSQAMVERAARRFRGAERLSLHRASAELLPLAAASVDRAVSVNSLYFWPDPAAAMAELARVLAPGGRLVLCFEPAEKLAKWPGHIFGFRLFAPAEVRALIDGAGFGGIEESWGTGRKPARFCCLSGERLGANG